MNGVTGVAGGRFYQHGISRYESAARGSVIYSEPVASGSSVHAVDIFGHGDDEAYDGMPLVQAVDCDDENSDRWLKVLTQNKRTLCSNERVKKVILKQYRAMKSLSEENLTLRERVRLLEQLWEKERSERTREANKSDLWQKWGKQLLDIRTSYMETVKLLLKKWPTDEVRSLFDTVLTGFMVQDQNGLTDLFSFDVFSNKTYEAIFPSGHAHLIAEAASMDCSPGLSDLARSAAGPSIPEPNLPGGETNHPKMRLRPRRGPGRSPSPRRSRSPARRTRSPTRRSRTPERRSRSPVRRSRSAVRRSRSSARSPSRYVSGNKLPARSPSASAHRSKSPGCRAKSPDNSDRKNSSLSGNGRQQSRGRIVNHMAAEGRANGRSKSPCAAVMKRSASTGNVAAKEFVKPVVRPTVVTKQTLVLKPNVPSRPNGSVIRTVVPKPKSVIQQEAEAGRQANYFIKPEEKSQIAGARLLNAPAAHTSLPLKMNPAPGVGEVRTPLNGSRDYKIPKIGEAARQPSNGGGILPNKTPVRASELFVANGIKRPRMSDGSGVVFGQTRTSGGYSAFAEKSRASSGNVPTFESSKQPPFLSETPKSSSGNSDGFEPPRPRPSVFVPVGVPPKVNGSFRTQSMVGGVPGYSALSPATSVVGLTSSASSSMINGRSSAFLGSAKISEAAAGVPAASSRIVLEEDVIVLSSDEES